MIIMNITLIFQSLFQHQVINFPIQIRLCFQKKMLILEHVEQEMLGDDKDDFNNSSEKNE